VFWLVFIQNQSHSFQIQDIRAAVICWMIFHSYTGKMKLIFCAQRVPPPNPIFPGWQLNRLDRVPSLDISASSSQFSQACHNYNVFDNAVVCVCFVWSSSNRESYLAVWVVSTCWSLAGCVYNGLHIAHLPLSLNCLLVCSHSCGEKKIFPRLYGIVYSNLSVIQNCSNRVTRRHRSFLSAVLAVKVKGKVVKVKASPVTCLRGL
jgi:hypothetical protein